MRSFFKHIQGIKENGTAAEIVNAMRLEKQFKLPKELRLRMVMDCVSAIAILNLRKMDALTTFGEGLYLSLIKKQNKCQNIFYSCDTKKLKDSTDSDDKISINKLDEPSVKIKFGWDDLEEELFSSPVNEWTVNTVEVSRNFRLYQKQLLLSIKEKRKKLTWRDTFEILALSSIMMCWPCPYPTFTTSECIKVLDSNPYRVTKPISTSSLTTSLYEATHNFSLGLNSKFTLNGIESDELKDELPTSSKKNVTEDMHRCISVDPFIKTFFGNEFKPYVLGLNRKVVDSKSPDFCCMIDDIALLNSEIKPLGCTPSRANKISSKCTSKARIETGEWKKKEKTVTNQTIKSAGKANITLGFAKATLEELHQEKDQDTDPTLRKETGKQSEEVKQEPIKEISIIPLLEEGVEQRATFDSITQTKQYLTAEIQILQNIKKEERVKQLLRVLPRTDKARVKMDFRRNNYGRIYTSRRFQGIPNGEWQDMTSSEQGNKSMICCRGKKARDLKRIFNEIYLVKILGEKGNKEFHCCECKGLMTIQELRNCKREGEEPRITYICERRKTDFSIMWKITVPKCEDGENEEKGEEVPEEWKRQKGGYSHDKSICDLECQMALAAATEAGRYTEI
ncbi:5510_t:CDS:10 [Diversispora eburnea]|uniref:5510_t:CDS:1 n=1 Tax=Diversispora eburnea TaxID=1213867 RepID=A0A9N9AUV4_9GLOM|nr:5510_t:CDS:10 [Diversispora eburnea]